MYPKPDVDPKTKGREWLLKYAQQAWKDGSGVSPNIFYGAAAKYHILKKYALGKQDISKYKTPYIDEKGETFATGLDYTIRPVISKYRDIAISKLQLREYNIVATPIDALAKSDADKYFADIKTKILMRNMLKQMNPEALESPQVKQQPGEAEDLEELEMQMNYTYKHNMAMEAEMVFALVADTNGFPEERNKVLTDLYDFGVGGYKEWNDQNGNTKLRAVNVENIITSYCRRADFTDAIHVGEVTEVTLNSLASIFSEEELKAIPPNQTAYQPFANVTPRDISKVQVLDLELITRDDLVFSQRENIYGNVVYGREKYEDYNPKKKAIIKGKEQPKYSTKGVENVYRVKWIIGTDLIYDYGMATNQKRDKSNPAKACLSYHLYAYNFYNMQAIGVMERLQPTLDEYQETVVKIRNFKNKWIPYIIDIDMEALENVSLGGGGEKNMKPMELLDMMWQTNVMLSRKRDMSSGNINYKSVDIQQTPMASEFQVLLADLGRLLQEISDLSGFNQLTDASTPNAKTLTTVANSAIDATNNSQYPIIRADKSLNERLAKGVIMRVQIAIKSGKAVEGITRALGDNTVKFFKASDDFYLYEIAIMVEDRPTSQERSLLMQELNIKNAEGQIDPEVLVVIQDTPNLKQARMMLAYYTKKKREKDQQQALQMQQQNGQIQIQSAQATEQFKQQTIQVQLQADLQIVEAKGQWDLKVAQVKGDNAMAIQESSAGIKLTGQMMQQDRDERKEKIKQGITPIEPAMEAPEQPGKIPTKEQMDPELQPA